MLIPAVIISKVIYVSLKHGNLSYRARLRVLIGAVMVIIFSAFVIGLYSNMISVAGQALIVYGLEFFLFVNIMLNDYTKAIKRRRVRRNRKRVRNEEKSQ